MVPDRAYDERVGMWEARWYLEQAARLLDMASAAIGDEAGDGAADYFTRRAQVFAMVGIGQALPELVTRDGLTATAERLGVSKATLGYWLLKMELRVTRVVLAPGDSLEVRREASRVQ